MRIRIKNLDAQNLIHVVVGLGTQMYLLNKDTFEKLKDTATSSDEMKLNFVTEYGDVSIETVIKFKKFCNEFHLVDTVIVSGSVLYGFSQWRGGVEQVVIEAE